MKRLAILLWLFPACAIGPSPHPSTNDKGEQTGTSVTRGQDAAAGADGGLYAAQDGAGPMEDAAPLDDAAEAGADGEIGPDAGPGDGEAEAETGELPTDSSEETVPETK